MPNGVRRSPARAGGPTQCTCPACGYTQAHIRGQPCAQTTCPQCGQRMIGKWD